MRRTFALSPVLSLALLALPLLAHADDASKRAKVGEVLVLTKTDAVSQQMLASFPERVKAVASRQIMVQAANTPEQKKLAADYLDQMGKIAGTGADWKAVEPKLVDLYMATFSEPELDGMIAFYKSPAGQAMVTKTPELSNKTLQILQAPINALAPQFEAATKAYQTNMQNTSPAGGSGDAAPSKPPTTPATKSNTPKK